MKYKTAQIIEKLRTIKIVPVIAVEEAEAILPLVETFSKKWLTCCRDHFSLCSSRTSDPFSSSTLPRYINCGRYGTHIRTSHPS